MDLLYQIAMLVGAALVAFLAGRGFTWNTKRKAKKEVLDEVEQKKTEQYEQTKAKIHARNAIDNVDAAREFLRDRPNRR